MQLQVLIRRLGQMRPFSLIAGEALRLVAFGSEEVMLPRGSVLFRQGEAADCGYAVFSGAVALHREAAVPQPERVLGQGSVIGLNAMIVPTERPATATVRADVVLVKITRRVMQRVLEAFPDCAAALERETLAGLARQAAGLARIGTAIDAVALPYRSSETSTGT